jgi:hypothetical protein
LLAWVAGCNFVTVAAATYLTWDDSPATRVLAVVVALAVGLGAAFGITVLGAWASAPSTAERSHSSPERVQPNTRQDDAVGRERATVAERDRQPGPGTDEIQLTRQLALGNRLRARLEQAIADAAPNGTAQLIPEIDNWIATTRALLDVQSPELARYFATDTPDLAEANLPPRLQDVINLSQSSRLARHLERLNEIVSGRVPR